MNQLTTKFDAATGEGNGTRLPASRSLIDRLAAVLIKLGILTKDLDYHLIRASMVIVFFFFGYQKWWAYEAERLLSGRRMDIASWRAAAEAALAGAQPRKHNAFKVELAKRVLVRTLARAGAMV